MFFLDIHINLYNLHPTGVCLLILSWNTQMKITTITKISAAESLLTLTSS